MKKRAGLLSAAALLAALAGLYILRLLMMPKYMDEIRDGALIREYYGEPKDHDVVFVGDCEVYENFSPVTLWKEYGITSYIRGSAQQMIWQSYYLMEETLRYETPKVMVFNVLAMKYDSPESAGSQSHREAYNRMALDGMRWSKSKWDSISASMTAEEKKWDGHWTYIFPLLRFHSRWKELTADDFRYIFRRDKVSDNGYLMFTGVKPLTNEHVERPPRTYTFGENSYYYLNKMVRLCKSHGTQLVLVKSPTLYPVWWDEYEEQIQKYAKENGLLYVNLLDAAEDIGIDWSTDTFDTGLHLNVYGAEKLSSYFGKVLREECGVQDRRGDSEVSKIWAEKEAAYERRKSILKSEEKNGM